MAALPRRARKRAEGGDTVFSILDSGEGSLIAVGCTCECQCGCACAIGDVVSESYSNARSNAGGSSKGANDVEPTNP